MSTQFRFQIRSLRTSALFINMHYLSSIFLLERFLITILFKNLNISYG